MLILVFLLLSNIARADLAIFYLNSSQYRPVDGKGGLTLAVSKIKEMKKKFRAHLFLLCEEEDVDSEKEFVDRINICQRAGVDAMLATPSLMDNRHIYFKEGLSLPLLAANLFEKASLSTLGIAYKNLIRDGIKISILGLPEEYPMGENLFKAKTLPPKTIDQRKYEKLKGQQLEFRAPYESFKYTIDLLKTNFNPDVIILLTNRELSKDLIELIKERDIVLISTKESPDCMCGPLLEEGKLGLIDLEMKMGEIVDYKLEDITLSTKLDKARDPKKEFEERLESIEKTEGKRAAKDFREAFERDLNRPVEEDLSIIEY